MRNDNGTIWKSAWWAWTPLMPVLGVLFMVMILCIDVQNIVKLNQHKHADPFPSARSYTPLIPAIHIYIYCHSHYSSGRSQFQNLNYSIHTRIMTNDKSFQIWWNIYTAHNTSNKAVLEIDSKLRLYEKIRRNNKWNDIDGEYNIFEMLFETKPNIGFCALLTNQFMSGSGIHRFHEQATASLYIIVSSMNIRTINWWMHCAHWNMFWFVI